MDDRWIDDNEYRVWLLLEEAVVYDMMTIYSSKNGFFNPGFGRNSLGIEWDI